MRSLLLIFRGTTPGTRRIEIVFKNIRFTTAHSVARVLYLRTPSCAARVTCDPKRLDVNVSAKRVPCLAPAITWLTCRKNNAYNIILIYGDDLLFNYQVARLFLVRKGISVYRLYKCVWI